MKKRIVSLFLVIVVVLSFGGCNDDTGVDRVIKYDISDNPRTLDPQQADELNSNLLIGNIYMGLMTRGTGGVIEYGCASDHIISDDGLKYTFKLRQDVYWINNGEFKAQCTAKDFVYGFTRLFLPETESQRAPEYFCIKNSEAVNSGKLTDTSQLGVKAKGDFELEFTLEYPDTRFLELLAEVPAMPCCEEFFLAAQGKYGLSAECTPSNGYFYLRSWTYDPHSSADINNLILRRNPETAKVREICPSGLNFFIEDETVFINDFLTNEINCLAVSNEDRPSVKGSNDCEEFSCITCGLLFNRNFDLFKNNDFRKALVMTADRGAIMEVISGVEEADGVVPKQVSIMNENYRGTVGSCNFPVYDADKALELFQKVRTGLDSSLFSSAKVIVPNTIAETAVSYILQEWQRVFGFYCTLKVLDEDDYLDCLQSGDYDAAILELRGGSNSPDAYLRQFAENGSIDIGYSDPEYNDLLNSAVGASEGAKSKDLYIDAEQYLIDNSIFVPLYYKNEYFFTSKKVKDVIYDPFTKMVNFSIAKYFK